ncbi:MAG TPA: adenosylcobinamide-GDP ribazoletransferase [Trebonia sp.]
MRRFSAWRNALSLFTVIPTGTDGELGEGDAARAVLWMPAVGLLLGVAGAGVIAGVAVTGDGDSGPRRLLGAALAVALLALLTGGLHLDGLADTADGLGSRRPAPDALDIMRRSDVGPMGVATLVLVLLIQVTALAAEPSAPAAGFGLMLATVTGRTSVVLATGSRAARPGGFGALVAGQTSARGRLLSAMPLAVVVVGGGLGFGGWELIIRGLAAAAAGLAAGTAVRVITVRRLGGVTGDVFGAVMEISTAAALTMYALVG